MKTFHCQYCGHPTFFENTQCLKCSSSLAFLPDRLNLAAVEVAAQDGENLWRPRVRSRHGKSSGRYRLCRNHVEHGTCNFAVPLADPNDYCVSCRQTRVLPDLSVDGNLLRWTRVETAKRRLVYTLAKLGLMDTNPPDGGNDGPVYEFKADTPTEQVMTGHANGLITLNVSEADDDERVRRRIALHEPYRTLLGHLRHESGHYYWDRLIRDGGRVESCRELFGDESVDYAEALQKHYDAGGMPENWQDAYVSAYATSHPWEDWAETWAHYLHMVDLLETAASYNTHISLPGAEEELEEVVNPFDTGVADFNELVGQWVPVTLLVNSLNRSLGQEDAYPFALSPGALRKLRYVHDVITEVRTGRKPRSAGTQAPSPAAPPEQEALPQQLQPEDAPTQA